MQRLVLFDIDETILSSYGCGRRALERALTAHFGQAVSLEGNVLSGKTDPQIIKEALHAHNLSEQEITRALPAIFAHYLPALKDEVSRASNNLHLHAGIIELIERLLERSDVFLGLLTGNIEPGARVKLEPFGLNRFFGFGAFGSDAHDRMDLPAIAQQRAAEHLKRCFGPQEMVIIGDARNDVLCAKGFGARSLAVATGRTERQALAALEPDFLFDDLADTQRVLAAIFAN